MSQNLKSQNSSEEVDLGQLFKLIGNAFTSLFSFIAGFFKSIYNLLILLLLHFYKRLYWYVTAIILGFIIGFIVDLNSGKLYGANMFIKTNFDSARQVYENVKQFHQLANVDKDYLELSNMLGISEKEASSLKGFYIQPDVDENIIAEMFSDFYTNLDSLSRKEMSYENYKSSLTPYNFEIHMIGIASTDKFIYKKIEKTFANGLAKNDYLSKLQKINIENLNRQGETLKNQITKTDSLTKEYLKIRINESKKNPLPGSGTNLYMGDSGDSNSLIVDESILIGKKLLLEEQRRQVFLDLVEKKEIINLVAGFPYTGYDMKSWYYKSKFIVPLALFTLIFIVFMILGLGKFLKEKEQ